MVIHLSASAAAARTVRLCDESAGLDGVIVIHSTALGPAAGGCRFWPYPEPRLAVDDAYRLAQGMSYKNALAGLPFGGGKAVLRVPDGTFDRNALFRAFGRAVEDLHGAYITAEDVGTTIADMQAVASMTGYVAGLEVAPGQAGGDPSPWTAQGVFEAMAVSARVSLGAELADLTVAVQGVGNVGRHLCRKLANAGARLIIADVNAAHCSRLVEELGARPVPVADIAGVEADVFAPCALGGALSLATVPTLRAKLVCGGANNQLATPQVGAMLVDHGITYVPDYVANAGGIISVTAEYLGENRESVADRVSQIGPRVSAILAEALRDNVSPAHVADRMAERIIAG